MDIGSVVNQGLIGMQKSQSSMVQSAQQIAQAGNTQGSSTQGSSAPTHDLVEPMVNMKVQAQVFDSSAKVIKSADETLGTLLDINA